MTRSTSTNYGSSWSNLEFISHWSGLSLWPKSILRKSSLILLIVFLLANWYLSLHCEEYRRNTNDLGHRWPSVNWVPCILILKPHLDPANSTQYQFPWICPLVIYHRVSLQFRTTILDPANSDSISFPLTPLDLSFSHLPPEESPPFRTTARPR